MRNVESASALTLRPATSPAERAAAFRVRYRAYCLERKFESPLEFPDGEESDADDARSLSLLLLHVPSESAVGCVRLVWPDPGLRLPTEKFETEPLTWADGEMDRSRMCEVSRLAVLKGAVEPERNGRGAVGWPDGARRVGALEMSAPLCAAATETARENGMETALALMEPALVRLLRMRGYPFQKLGPTVSWAGVRQPALLDLREALQRAASDPVNHAAPVALPPA